MDREEEKEKAVDLWLLAKTLKKKGISISTIERILRLYKHSKQKTNGTKVMVKK